MHHPPASSSWVHACIILLPHFLSARMPSSNVFFFRLLKIVLVSFCQTRGREPQLKNCLHHTGLRYWRGRVKAPVGRASPGLYKKGRTSPRRRLFHSSCLQDLSWVLPWLPSLINCYLDVRENIPFPFQVVLMVFWSHRHRLTRTNILSDTIAYTCIHSRDKGRRTKN